jgi:hypothetical protein
MTAGSIAWLESGLESRPESGYREAEKWKVFSGLVNPSPPYHYSMYAIDYVQRVQPANHASRSSLAY